MKFLFHGVTIAARIQHFPKVPMVLFQKKKKKETSKYIQLSVELLGHTMRLSQLCLSSEQISVSTLEHQVTNSSSLRPIQTVYILLNQSKVPVMNTITPDP